MDSISFSTNWNNKLSGQYYTTIRLASAKYQVGKRFEILLRKKLIHQAEIVDISYQTLERLNTFIIGVDMGLDLTTGITILQKMYANVDLSKQRFVLVLLKVINEKKALEEKLQQAISGSNDQTLTKEQFDNITNSLQYQNANGHNLTESQMVHNFRLRQLQQLYRGRSTNG